MPEPATRDELLAGYRRPYARWLPRLYELNRVGPLLGVGAAVAAATVLWAARGDVPGGVVFLAELVTVMVVSWALWVTLAGVRVIRARTAQWRAHDDSELARVRERRPHAADADPEVAHAEYAVSVVEGGALVTWSFTPLAALESPAAGDGLLVGTPRYAVREVARTAHDAVDTALAAEQLAAAQEDAAHRERDAAEAARAELAERDRARELAAETASTGSALRGATGQDER